MNFIHGTFKLFVDEVKTWPGYEKYAVKLDNLQYKFMRNGKAVYTTNKKDGYNVLNHGDFHFKNMLFKKNDISKKISDVLFVS